jgi:hypothetical protein
MLTTRFTELVGCSVPIQQAGMGSHANPRLAAAVAEAGGLGMVSVYGHYGGPPENIARMLDDVSKQTSGTFGANFILGTDPVASECVRRRQPARVVDFFWGEPTPHWFGLSMMRGHWPVGRSVRGRAQSLPRMPVATFSSRKGSRRVDTFVGRVGILALLDQVLEAVTCRCSLPAALGAGGLWRPCWLPEPMAFG